MSVLSLDLKKDCVILETLLWGIYGLKGDERRVELTSATSLFGNYENQGNSFWAGDNKAILMKPSAFGPSGSLCCLPSLPAILPVGFQGRWPWANECTSLHLR